ncbi:MAG: hypothetical protein AAGE03_01200 [Pseudomonadota bacterium]
MDERDWTDRALTAGETLVLGDCTIGLDPPRAATLVSGNVAAALDMLTSDVPILGLAEQSAGPAFALRIARDQVLLITNKPLSAGEGWYGPGFALSRADDRFQAFQINGPGARDILAQGTSAPINVGSPSAAILFGGVFALLSGTKTGYLLWIERGWTAYLTSFLRMARPLD